MKPDSADDKLKACSTPTETGSLALSAPAPSEGLKCSAWDTRTKIQVVLCVVGAALFIAALATAGMVWYRIYVTYRGEVLAFLHFIGPALLLSFAALCAFVATLACAIGTYINIAARAEVLKAKCLAMSDNKHRSTSEEKTGPDTSVETQSPTLSLREVVGAVKDEGAAVILEHGPAPEGTSPVTSNTISPAAKMLHAVDTKLNRLATLADEMESLLDLAVDISGSLDAQIPDAKTGTAQMTSNATQLVTTEATLVRSTPTLARSHSIYPTALLCGSVLIETQSLGGFNR